MHTYKHTRAHARTHIQQRNVWSMCVCVLLGQCSICARPVCCQSSRRCDCECVCVLARVFLFMCVYAYCRKDCTGERWVGARLRLDTVLSATSLDTCSARASYQVSETHLLHFLLRYFVASYSVICWDVAKVTYCHVYAIWCTHTPTYTCAWTA